MTRTERLLIETLKSQQEQLKAQGDMINHLRESISGIVKSLDKLKKTR